MSATASVSLPDLAPLPAPPKSWTTQRAAELYSLEGWGKDFFEINDQGELCVRLQSGTEEKAVSLPQIAAELETRGLDLPILLRFPDFLERRLRALCATFAHAIAELGYQAPYRGVYPIKVNQQDQIVETVARLGREFHFGLEAGSKAELIAALAYMHDPEAYVVCNGYKDAEFVDLALHATRLGLQVILVVEMPEEVDLILARAEALGVEPLIGVRIKLATESGGHWNDSGGDRSVFGLNVAQLVDLVDRLKAAGRLDCLKMLHYHQGSQIPQIGAIREAAAEAARIYVALVQEGAPLGLLDVGGGLAVDYDGSRTNFAASCNYSMREYCLDVIETVMATLDAEEVPHPVIISESGRALVAHSSVLLFNVFEVTRFTPRVTPDTLAADAPEALRHLFETAQTLSARRLQEGYNDAVYYRQELRNQFAHGNASLRDRAQGDEIFWTILARIAAEVRRLGRDAPPDLVDVGTHLVDIYHVNFSVFQSLPDAWAIGQLFPVMPVHRLDEEPTERGIMADITCDCDGKLDKFIDFHDVRTALPLHALQGEQDYILGAFLVGAYQETLGDLHNLLGDTHVANITLEDGELAFGREIEGDSIADVLSYVEYDPKQLRARFRDLAERAVRRRLISADERRQVLRAYEEGLRSYTYFND